MARTTTFPPLGVWTLGIAATLSAFQHAAAATAPVASASLSGLTLRLIDLTPGDGVGPSVTFGTGDGLLALVQTLADESVNTVSLSGLPFTSQSATLGLSSAAILTDSLSAQASLDLNRIEIGADAPVDDANLRLIRHSAERYATAGVMIGDGAIVGEGAGAPLSFVLGANTAMVLEGRAVLSASSFAGAQADITNAAMPLFGLSPDGSLLSTNYYSGSVAQAGVYWDFDGAAIEDIDESKLFQTYAETFSEGDQLQNIDQSFALTLTNDTGASRAGQLLMATNAHVYQRLELLESIPLVTNPIPEPATYALMGLGLVGLAWARRRHAG